jgi:hypothetical protein
MSIKNKDLAEFTEFYGCDETLKADGFDDCIVGIDSKQRMVYDEEKIIKKLMDDMTHEEAVEFYYFNIEGSHVGEHTPLYMTILGDFRVQHRKPPQQWEQTKKAKRGNPDWYKGMRSPNPYGRGGTPYFIESFFDGIGNFLNSYFK